MTRILLLGKNGQVGWELQRSLQPLGDVFALSRQVDVETGFCGNLADFDAITQVITHYQPQIIVNAAAYTAVDQAEHDIQQADLINHLAVRHLAQLAHQHQALLIHYSTDYVFDGSKSEAWIEEDKTCPINVYGQSKRDGEIALEQSNVKFINFRTSWVYATHGHNFIKTMLKLAQQKETLHIIDDQIGRPTAASLIADVTAQVIRQYLLQPHTIKMGHYHLTAQGDVSWYQYACYIFEIARELGIDLQVKQVNAILSKDYSTPAKRPLNSRLDSTKLQQQFLLKLPPWQQGVRQVIGELYGYQKT